MTSFSLIYHNTHIGKLFFVSVVFIMTEKAEKDFVVANALHFNLPTHILLV